MKLNKFLNKLNNYHENINVDVVDGLITINYNDLLIATVELSEYYDKAFLDTLLDICDEVIALGEQEDDDDYCIQCHNLMLIDQIINNTLSKDSDITPQQADTMLKLASLRQALAY